MAATPATPATPMPRLPRRIVTSLSHNAEDTPKTITDPAVRGPQRARAHAPAHCRPSRGPSWLHGTGAAPCPGSCGRDSPIPTADASMDLFISPYSGGLHHSRTRGAKSRAVPVLCSTGMAVLAKRTDMCRTLLATRCWGLHSPCLWVGLPKSGAKRCYLDTGHVLLSVFLEESERKLTGLGNARRPLPTARSPLRTPAAGSDKHFGWCV